jgi:hypothetical protein
VAVEVGVSVSVAVAVAVEVEVGVGVTVAVEVAVAVAVWVAVAVLVMVGVSDAMIWLIEFENAHAELNPTNIVKTTTPNKRFINKLTQYSNKSYLKT